jgi:hypothetical protein
VDSNLAQVRQQQARAIAAGASDRAELWRQIEEENAALQRLVED